MTPAKAKCPRCGNRVEWNGAFPFRPFCSERCKLIDLGAWLDESHRIPGSMAEETASDSDLREEG